MNNPLRKLPVPGKNARIDIAAGLAVLVANGVVTVLARKSGHVTGDGKRIDAHAGLVAAVTAIAVGAIIRLVYGDK